MKDIFRQSDLQSLQVANSFDAASGKITWTKRPSLSSNTPRSRGMKKQFLQ